jgi:hypothetical protein
LGLYEEQKTSCDVLLVLIASRERLNVCVSIMIAVFGKEGNQIQPEIYFESTCGRHASLTDILT